MSESEPEEYSIEDLLEDAAAIAGWHVEDGDECGVIARRVFAALGAHDDHKHKLAYFPGCFGCFVKSCVNTELDN
jgi:hypothetical protein